MALDRKHQNRLSSSPTPSQPSKGISSGCLILSVIVILIIVGALVYLPALVH